MAEVRGEGAGFITTLSLRRVQWSCWAHAGASVVTHGEGRRWGGRACLSARRMMLACGRGLSSRHTYTDTARAALP